MRLFAIIPGLALILIILWDAFETIILPRRVTRRLRLTSVFYGTMWMICSGMVRAMRNRKRREKYLGTFGPLSLLMLLALWAASRRPTDVTQGRAPLHVAGGISSPPNALAFK